VFSYRDTREGDLRLEVAFTDASLDLQGLRPGFEQSLPALEEACGVRFARMNQVHGDTVLLVDEPGPAPADPVPTADALLTTTPGLGLMVRVADCVPVLLADPASGVLAAVHAGRAGVALDVVGTTVARMREAGAGDLLAWVGPHVCGGCYEVPAVMREEVAAAVPETRAETTWGTPSLDLGAGVRAQLRAHGVEAVEVDRCTREDASLHSHRRDGAASGRMAGLVWTVVA
jgi:YfiH family protein